VRSWKALLLFAVAATAARIGGVWFTEPSPQEAYYFLCSQRLAPAYFDGPAGTAFLTWVAATYESEIIWRLVAPLWALGATLACFALVRQLADTARAVWAALLLNALPAFNSSALRVGPELPALTLTLLGLLAAWCASQAGKEKLLFWTGAGLAFGAAMSFAYATLAILPGLIYFALYDIKRRAATDYFGVCLLLAIPALSLVLPLLWNAQQDWIPIAGGTLRTMWEFQWGSFFNSLISAFVAFSPLLLPAIILGCARAFAERKDDARARFIFWCSFLSVVLGIYLILRGDSGILYFLLVTPLLLLKAMDLFASRPRLAAGLRWSVILLALIFSVFAIIDATQAGRGWREAASELTRLFLEKSAEGQEDLFLIAEDPGLASVLGYHLRNDFVAPAGHPTVYVRESQDISNQFSLWPSYADFTELGRVADEYFTEQEAENAFLGRSALYISREHEDELPQAIGAAFESVSLFRELPGAGNDPRPLYIYLCLNYQTLPL
jgi:hypothetical protein